MISFSNFTPVFQNSVSSEIPDLTFQQKITFLPYSDKEIFYSLGFGFTDISKGEINVNGNIISKIEDSSLSFFEQRIVIQDYCSFSVIFITKKNSQFNARVFEKNIKKCAYESKDIPSSQRFLSLTKLLETYSPSYYLVDVNEELNQKNFESLLSDFKFTKEQVFFLSKKPRYLLENPSKDNMETIAKQNTKTFFVFSILQVLSSSLGLSFIPYACLLAKGASALDFVLFLFFGTIGIIVYYFCLLKVIKLQKSFKIPKKMPFFLTTYYFYSLVLSGIILGLALLYVITDALPNGVILASFSVSSLLLLMTTVAFVKKFIRR